MKNKILLCALMVFAVSLACGQGAQNNGKENLLEDSGVRINISIGSREFTAVMYDNDAAKSFILKLPLTLNMTDHGRNEKYYNFSQNFPGVPQRPETINTGDLMIWSSNTLVLFYKTFNSSYNYISIGRILDTTGLESALGQGNVNVSFALEN